MPDKFRRKIPTQPEKRHPKKARQSKQIEEWKSRSMDWLPPESADFTAWAQVVERAMQEYRDLCSLRAWNWDDEKLCQAAESAHQLVGHVLTHAYPSGYWEGWEDLKAGKTDNLESYIVFLEADLHFFRSGYEKANVIRYLNRFPLTTLQQRRLQMVVLHVLDKGWRREFRAYCRLARHVQSPDWLKEVEARLTSSDPNLALRAKWVLTACLQK